MQVAREFVDKIKRPESAQARQEAGCRFEKPFKDTNVFVNLAFNPGASNFDDDFPSVVHGGTMNLRDGACGEGFMFELREELGNGTVE